MSNATDALRVAPAPITGDVARALIGALNAELSAEYHEPGGNHFRLDPDVVTPGAGVFLVAELAGRPVGCGALRCLRTPERAFNIQG